MFNRNDFVKIESHYTRRTNTENRISARITISDGRYYLNFNIGKEVAAEAGLKPRDMVTVMKSKFNPRIMSIEKSNDESGYRLNTPPKGNLRISIRIPTLMGYRLKKTIKIDHEIHDNVIMINTERLANHE